MAVSCKCSPQPPPQSRVASSIDRCRGRTHRSRGFKSVRGIDDPPQSRLEIGESTVVQSLKSRKKKTDKQHRRPQLSSSSLPMSSVLSSDVLIIALRVLVLLIVRYVSSLACFINFRPCVGPGLIRCFRLLLVSFTVLVALVLLWLVLVHHSLVCPFELGFCVGPSLRLCPCVGLTIALALARRFLSSSDLVGLLVVSVVVCVSHARLAKALR